MVKELLHCFCSFECNSLFTIGCVKGGSPLLQILDLGVPHNLIPNPKTNPDRSLHNTMRFCVFPYRKVLRGQGPQGAWGELSRWEGEGAISVKTGVSKPGLSIVKWMPPYPKNLFKDLFRIENAPTCYRAPKWPDPEFPRKIPKKYPPARNSGTPRNTPKIPRKYRKNTPKIPKTRIFGIFFGILGGIFFGFQNFGPGVFFRYFSWKFRVGPSRGSVAGWGVLKFRR